VQDLPFGYNWGGPPPTTVLCVHQRAGSKIDGGVDSSVKAVEVGPAPAWNFPISGSYILCYRKCLPILQET
jgi:hypothetical protein